MDAKMTGSRFAASLTMSVMCDKRPLQSDRLFSGMRAPGCGVQLLFPMSERLVERLQVQLQLVLEHFPHFSFADCFIKLFTKRRVLFPKLLGSLLMQAGEFTFFSKLTNPRLDLPGQGFQTLLEILLLLVFHLVYLASVGSRSEGTPG
jgi:hypothetical protein